MNKSVKKLFSVCLILCLVITQFFVFGSASAAETKQFKRISGSDRYKTAIEISKNGWTASQYAVLARGDDFPDALCAGPLAKKYNAPILLTQTDTLNPDVLAELERLGVETVFITGGTGAVSANVENALKSASIKVERLYGADRYETSVKIAEKLGTVKKIVLATGLNFPDALSISAIASKMGMPILLTEKNSLHDKVKQYVSNMQPEKTYIIGGTGVIGDEVKALFPSSVRIGGNDRFGTNTLVMQEFINELDFNSIYTAVGDGPKGDEFADALSGAVLASNHSAPIVLTYKTLPEGTGNFIKSKVKLASTVTALGGEAVVPSNIVNSLIDYINQVPVKANYDKAGTYGPDQVTETVAGNVIISVRDVTLQNTIIEGDLLLAEGIGDGNVTLKNVTIKGTTTVRGGGPNSVVLINFNGQSVVVDVPDGGNVRLVAEGTTSVSSVTMNSNGRLEESGLTGSGFTSVNIPEGAQVTLIGTFDTVNVAAAGAQVNVESGSISTLNIANSAGQANINLNTGTSVATLTVSAPVDVTGTGSITTANVKSDGVTIEQKPATTNVDNGLTASVGGNIVNGTPQAAPGGSGGGGGGNTPTVSVSRINVSNATTVSFNSNVTGATINWNGISYGTTVNGANSITVPLIVSGANNTLVVEKSGYATFTKSDVVWTEPYGKTAALGEWRQDRTQPLSWAISQDGWITHTTAAQQNADSWYDWQGLGAFTNVGVSDKWKVETQIDLTNELTTGSGVRTSMWVQVDGINGVASTQNNVLDWAILQYKNDQTTQQKGWESWDSNGSGSWISLNGVSTAEGIYTLTMIYDSGKMSQYINGKLVRKYNVTTDAGFVESAPSYVIIQSRTYGESYTAKWKVPTVKYVEKYPVGTKFILTGDQLDAAISNQKDNETWVIKAGDYYVKSKYRFDIDSTGDNGYNKYYFPIKANNLTIIGQGNPTIYSSDLSLNGVRATQNFISIYGDGVTIDGLKIMSKLEANKAIEVMGDRGGKNFILKNSSIVKNTLAIYSGTNVSDYFGKNAPITADSLEFAGSIYFKGAVGSCAIENVRIENGGISFGAADASSTIAFNGVTIDNSTATYAWVKNYKYSVNYTATVTGLNTIKIVGANTKGDLVVTNKAFVDDTVTISGVKYFKDYDAFNSVEDAISTAAKGDKIYIEPGTYYYTGSSAPIAPEGVTMITNGVTFVKVDRDISTVEQLSEAIANQTDGQTWLINPGTYDLPISVVKTAGQTGWYFPIFADNITIKGIGNPVIKSTVETPNGGWSSQNFITVLGNDVTIDGLEIVDKKDSNKCIEVCGNNCTIKNCRFTGNSEGYNGGVYSGNNDNTISKINIEDNYFTDESCVYLTNGTAGITVKDNTFENANLCFVGATDSGWNLNDIDITDAVITGNTIKGLNGSGKAVLFMGKSEQFNNSTVMKNFVSSIIENNEINAVTVKSGDDYRLKVFDGANYMYIYTKVQTAVDYAVPGDTINVADGTYTGNCILINKPIYLKAESHNTVISAVQIGHTVFVDGPVTIDGFKFVGTEDYFADPTHPQRIFIGAKEHDITIKNNIFEGNDSSIAPLFTSAIAPVSYSNMDFAVNNLTVSGNTFNGYSAGIYLNPYVTNANVLNNTFNDVRYAVAAGSTQGITIDSNVLNQSGLVQFRPDALLLAKDIEIKNNSIISLNRLHAGTEYDPKIMRVRKEDIISGIVIDLSTNTFFGKQLKDMTDEELATVKSNIIVSDDDYSQLKFK